MKKILMFLYNWPPQGEVSVLRSLKFVKYLTKLWKWDITVLTVKDIKSRIYCGEEWNIPEVKVVRTKHTDIISEMKRRFTFSIPDEYIGWYKYAIREGMKLLKNDDYDLIYSSSPPETAHIIAHRVKSKTKIPWVADLRDLWSRDHYRERSFFKKHILTFIEKKTFSNADAIITVSEPLQDMLKSLHKEKAGDIYCITNGFDPEDFEESPSKNGNKFILSYMGKINPIHQDPTIFFISLFELLKENKIDKGLMEVKFYTYGFRTVDIKDLSKRYQLEDVITVLPPVEYKKVLKLMRDSSVLLLFPWRGYGSDGWYSQKVFDYLGARRPILAIGSGQTAAEKLIKSTNSGYVAKDKDEIKKILGNLYGEFKALGKTAYQGIEEKIGKYSRANTANQLSEIFESVSKKV